LPRVLDDDVQDVPSSEKRNGLGGGGHSQIMGNAIDFTAIFQPFHRVHTDRIVKGFGIGLTTCKKIIELHGGSIWVDSQFGLGSTFAFSIAR